MEWTAATKDEVLAAIGEVAAHAGPEVWAEYSRHIVDPYPVSIERFGLIEQAFVVATMPHRVVFYDDVEDYFGTATEIDGKLVDVGMCDDLRLALRAAEDGA